MPICRYALCLPILVFACPAFATEPTIWPQWRGPSRDGQVTAPAWPDTLKPEILKPLWRVAELGPSYSGPVVSAELVFVTETANKENEVVIALDRKTGKEVWRTKWAGSMSVPFFAAKNGSWIRSTPALNGDTLYVGGMRDLLVALDANSGQQRWRLDFVKEFDTPLPAFGFASSPLVGTDGVYVQAGGGVVKVDAKTGKVRWRALSDGGGMNGSAFASPVLARFQGKDQVVVQARTKMAGLEPSTGGVLWEREIPAFRGMNILTPVPVGDGILTSTYGGTTQLFQIKAGPLGFTTADGWMFKYEGNMSTPVVVADHAYLLGRDRRLLCINVKTGKLAWATDERFGEYWSLVANGDKILALDNRGLLYLLKANPVEFELLDKRKIADSETWAHLAVCGDELFIRDSTGISAFRWFR